MKTILTVSQMRQSDNDTISSGISSLTLMINAASGILSLCSVKPPVAVVCGKGNNGGDGFAIALLLKRRNIPVSVFTIWDNVSEDADYYRRMCISEGVNVSPFSFDSDLTGFKTIFDCIFGTGFRIGAESLSAAAIDKINSSGAYIVSADINSGLNGDSGIGGVHVVSDLTVAVQNYKTGHFLNMAKDSMKEKKCCDIGIKVSGGNIHLIEDSDVKSAFRRRNNFSAKSNYGYICLIGGSRQYSGAAKLAAMSNAAARSGAGVVRLAVPGCIADAVMPFILETTLYMLKDDGNGAVFDESQIKSISSGFRTIAVGMGMGNTKETEKIVSCIIENACKNVVIDADGLNAVSSMGTSVLDRTNANIIITPHTREFSRLTGLSDDEILENPVRHACDFAIKHNVTVLLKGPSTVVTNGHDVYLSDTGCPGMATAGSGDVLSGVIAALLASSPADTCFTCACASYITGMAGQRAQNKKGAVGMIASDTIAEIPFVIKDLTGF